MVELTAAAAAACFFVLATGLWLAGRHLPGARAMDDAALAQASVGVGLLVRVAAPDSVYGPVFALATISYGAHGVWMLSALHRLAGRTPGWRAFGLPMLAGIAVAATWGLWNPSNAYPGMAVAYALAAAVYAACAGAGRGGQGRARWPLAVVAACSGICAVMLSAWSAAFVVAPDAIVRRADGPWLAASFLLALWLNLVVIGAYLAVVVGRMLDEMAEHALQDPLTGCANRRGLERWAAAHLADAARAGRPARVAVLAVDLDHFKRINDRHGHAAGDAALVACARRLQQGLRPHDLLARIGGEEFVVVLADLDAGGARAVAERLRHDLATHPVPAGAGLPVPIAVTASIGVAAGVARTPDLAPLVSRADDALYAAKRGGRDRVTLADDPVSWVPATATATGRPA